MPAGSSVIDQLGERYLDELFAYDPGAARGSGDHRFDGALGPVGADASAARLRSIDDLAAQVENAASSARSLDDRVELLTLRHRLADERFHLVELESRRRNPLHELERGADPLPYTHEYAPAPLRAEGLAAQLEQLPEWLDAAAGELGDALDPGPRQLAIDIARGLATFYREQVGDVFTLAAHPGLGRRLHAAAADAAAACERYAAAVAERQPDASRPLGATRLLSLLHAQEGVEESADGLRRRADEELVRLAEELVVVAAEVAPRGSAADSVALMEDDHPTAASLVQEAAASLEAVRQFWVERDVVGIGEERCRVAESPPFLRWATAAFVGAGALAPAEVDSTYIVTPVDASWTEEQASQWLRSLNRWTLENIGVHEVYPGHFVHMLHGRRQPSRLRRQGGVAGFSEGWAHYTEQLAIEQGLAEGRPLLHLAQVQDALVRACRFRATLALHAEGAGVDDATRIFVEHALMPEFPARREAERGTYDPMYLSYTYGKLQILGWRDQLQQRSSFSLKSFHDTMLDSGFPPLAAVAELVLSDS